MIGKLPHSVSFPYPGSMAYDDAAVRSKCSDEIDDRPGYYAGVAWQRGERSNCARCTTTTAAIPTAQKNDAFAWDTHFNVLGLRYEPDEHWTLIAQLLDGVTVVGGGCRLCRPMTGTCGQRSC